MKIFRVMQGVGALVSSIQTLLGEFESTQPVGDAAPGKRPGRVQTMPRGDNGKPMKVQVHEVKTLDERVSYITGMIRKCRNSPKVRKMAVQWVSRKCGDKWCVPEKDNRAEVLAIHELVRMKVRYVRDTYGRDLYQHAERTVEFGGGDCDDYCVLEGSLLQAIGFPFICRVIETVDSGSWNHIYGLVGLPPRQPPPKPARPGMANLKARQVWFPLDASVDQPAGWEAPADMVKRFRDFIVN